MKFKVGDSVRIKRKRAGILEVKGLEGTVIAFEKKDPFKLPYLVQFDDGPVDKLYFNAKELEEV